MRLKGFINIWAVLGSILLSLVLVPTIFFSYQFFTIDLSTVDNAAAGYIFYVGVRMVLYLIEFPFTGGVVHGMATGEIEADFRPYFVLAAIIFYLIFIVFKLFKKKSQL